MLWAQITLAIVYVLATGITVGKTDDDGDILWQLIASALFLSLLWAAGAFDLILPPVF